MFLLMLIRAFDSEPLEMIADRTAAEARACEILSGYARDLPALGEPEKGPGELGPMGLVSRVTGVTVIPFVDGKPSREGRSYFAPEPRPKAKKGPRP